MLCFQTTNGGQTVQIWGDREGLKFLSDKIARLLNTEGGHLHIYTPELSDATPFGAPAAIEVVIEFDGEE